MSAQIDYVLYECAVGYALFSVGRQDNPAALKLKEVAETSDDLSKFGKMIKLVNFSPFQGVVQSLENTNALSEGLLPDYLKDVLELNLPKVSGKKSKITLGVAEKNLGGNIKENFPGVDCETVDTSAVVAELLRGIRQFQTSLIPGVKEGDVEHAGLALAHAYSRAKVKFSATKNDVNVICGLAAVDTQDRGLNQWFMRLREWYGWHFPELIKITSDNLIYAKLVVFIANKDRLTDEHKEEIAEMLDHDTEKAVAIIEAAKVSMGLQLSEHDIEMISKFAKYVCFQANNRKINARYLEYIMSQVAPNLQVLVGTIVGARLIAQAGSLVKLAKEPASTLQILGAEKALFRALKTKSNTPKYGLIYHSTFIARAMAKDKGRISRYLANKCAIAARIDCFSEKPSTVYGEALRKQVEDRLEFYSSGKRPAKNQDVMDEVAAAIGRDDFDDEEMDVDAAAKAPEPSPAKIKKSKKDKKRKRDDDAEATVKTDGEDKKKKKKSKAADEE